MKDKLDSDKLGDAFFLAHDGGEKIGNIIKVEGRISLRYDGKTYQTVQEVELEEC